MALDEDMLILYATETGNAEDVAERIGREAARRNLRPRVLSMDRYDARNLPLQNLVIFVVSTTGQGDPPATMKSFWRYVLRTKMTKLRNVHHAVFGLGDSGYQNFNVVSMKLHNRMAQLGATAVVPRGLGDDQHPSGYEGVLDPWLSSLWKAVQEKLSLPGFQADFHAAAWTLEPPKYRIVYHEHPLGPAWDDEFTAARRTWIEHNRAREMFEAASGSGYPVTDQSSVGRTSSSPVFAQVMRNVRLTDEAHEQNVRHLEFDLGDSKLEYSPGDVLGVMPCQDATAIDAFLERCRLSPDAYISVEPAAGFDQDQRRLAPVTIRSLVEALLDVDSASPRRYLFEVMMHFAQAEHEKEKLQEFASPEGRDDLYKYNQRERRTVLEVLDDFPSVHLPLEWLVQLVPKLRPRYFSISSSLKAHPSEIHVTVAVVEWKTPYNRTRRGLCSTWLSKLDSKTEVVPLWITKGILNLPPPSVPLILVGPGTGCAPFRAFIEERAALSANQPVAPVLFFFGCRYQAKDFLYNDLWSSLAKDGGVLSGTAGGGFFVAFSRDQAQKVYVQHKIREQGDLVWNLLQSGASVFVSGSAEKMPADVAAAFQDVIDAHATSASELKHVKDLEKPGRYTVEVWS